MYPWDAKFDCLLIQYKAAGKIVSTVEQQIAVTEEISKISRIESFAERFDADLGIDAREFVGRRNGFAAADVGLVEQHLPLQVRKLYLI